MSTTKQQPLGTIYEIPLGEIQVSDDNVRHHDPTKDLDELAASIKRHGLLQPVVLNGVYGKPPYELITGQRRFLAHEQILKWPTIRAVFTGNLSESESVVRSLVENLQRVQLGYEDTSKAVTYLYKEYSGDERRVHKETGLSLRKVRCAPRIRPRSCGCNPSSWRARCRRFRPRPRSSAKVLPNWLWMLPNRSLEIVAAIPQHDFLP